jgi:hypothetical protein
MKLTEKQKNYIVNQYNELKNDEQTLGEIHEIIVDSCLDEEIIDLSNDDDGDLFEEFSNEVWDLLESNNLSDN